MIAAPSSGAGKSMTTLAMLRAARERGLRAVGAKSGPDFLDPSFHQAASGAPSLNLDAWAMSPEDLRARAAEAAAGADLLVVEGAMGLLDGAPAPAAGGIGGAGSAADLATALGAPVVLVLDVARQGQSAAATALGFRAARPDLTIAGVVLNRVGSARHEQMIAAALKAAGIPSLGALPRSPALETPSRHLGLAPAAERGDLEAFLAGAARLAAEGLDLDALIAAARPLAPPSSPPSSPPNRLPPIGRRIAVARDAAFSFCYPHLLADWRAAGAAVSFFSPLGDEGPHAAADAVYLPGGYPELHAERLSQSHLFFRGLREAAAREALVYGECGGFMALGEALTDPEGRVWPMAGLLPVATSLAPPRRVLGYRRLSLCDAGAGALAARLGGAGLLGHEFHYARIVRQGTAPALFEAWDAEGRALEAIGLAQGPVCGSFAHLIAPETQGAPASVSGSASGTGLGGALGGAAP